MALAALIGLGSMATPAPGFGADAVSLDEIQGIWRQVSGEMGGRATVVKPLTFEVVGDAYTETETMTTSSNLAIDAIRSPVTYEESVHFHRPNAFTFPGILKVSGVQLVRAYRRANAARPSTFESRPGDGVFVETWEREGAVPPPDLPVARQLDGRWRLLSRAHDGRPDNPMFVRGSRIEISGTFLLRTDTFMKSGRLILEKGSNRVVLDQSSPAARMPGLIDLDRKEKTLKIIVNTHREARQPVDFVTRDLSDRLRVFKKDNGANDSRPK